MEQTFLKSFVRHNRQEYPCILWHPRIHYRIHISPEFVHILRQITPVYSILLFLLNIYFYYYFPFLAWVCQVVPFLQASPQERRVPSCPLNTFPTPSISRPPSYDYLLVASQGILSIEVTRSHSDTLHSAELLWMSYHKERRQNRQCQPIFPKLSSLADCFWLRKTTTYPHILFYLAQQPSSGPGPPHSRGF